MSFCYRRKNNIFYEKNLKLTKNNTFIAYCLTRENKIDFVSVKFDTRARRGSQPHE